MELTFTYWCKAPQAYRGLPINILVQKTVWCVRDVFKDVIYFFLIYFFKIHFEKPWSWFSANLCFCDRSGAYRASCWRQHLCRGSAEQVTLLQAVCQQLQ